MRSTSPASSSPTTPTRSPTTTSRPARAILSWHPPPLPPLPRARPERVFTCEPAPAAASGHLLRVLRTSSSSFLAARMSRGAGAHFLRAADYRHVVDSTAHATVDRTLNTWTSSQHARGRLLGRDYALGVSRRHHRSRAGRGWRSRRPANGGGNAGAHSHGALALALARAGRLERPQSAASGRVAQTEVILAARLFPLLSQVGEKKRRTCVMRYN